MYLTINKLIKYTFVVGMLALSVLVSSQEKDRLDTSEKVAGFVYDAKTDLPISAASVRLGDYSSVFTNDDGSFNLEVNDLSATIEISKDGYQSKLVGVKGRSNLKIYLLEEGFSSFYDEADMSYQKQALFYTTKSVSLLNTEESWKNAGTSGEKIIENATGINIKTRSGSPGIGSDMFIRGYSSLFANNQPLIVVDGVIFNNESLAPSILDNATFNPLSYIDVKDIASVVIEKDGGSVFGAKGGAGVIYITTQRATDLATRIEVTANGGINMAPQGLPVLESDDYRIYLTDLLQSNGYTGEQIASLPLMNDNVNSSEYYKYHNNTDWQKKTFNDSYTSNFGFKIRGGDEIAKYGLSIGYLTDDGIVKNTNFNRFNSRLNADIKVSDQFSMNASLGISQENRDLVDGGLSLTSNPIYMGLVKSPLLHPNVINGQGSVSPNLEDVDIFGIGNPQAIVNGFSGSRANYRFFGNLKANFDFNDQLQLSSIIGRTFDKVKENLFSPHIGIVDEVLKLGIGDNRLGSGAVRYSAINSDTKLTYSQVYNNIHRINSVGGFRLTMNESSSDRVITYNSANDRLTTIGDGDNTLAEINGHIGNWNDMTFYLANNYSLKNKYLVSFDVALNGSSRFGQEAKGLDLFSNKFGVFPSVGLGWVVSSEKFMAQLDAVDFLKLRTSYGISGNDDIGNYTASSYYTTNSYYYWTGLVRGNISNPTLQWENVAKANVGIDLALFNERLSISLDYFNNVTSEMLTRTPVSESVGFDYYWGNDGKMKNTGTEISVRGRILNGRFNWDMGISASMYKNTLLELPVEHYMTTIAGATILSEVGQSAGLFYGYKTDGVYASDAIATASGLLNLNENTSLSPFQGGDVRFVELAHDGAVDNILDENDMQVIGDPNPDLTGAFSNAFSYNGFKLDLLVNYSVGGDVYNFQRAQLESMSTYENQTQVVLNRWTSNGQITDVPRAVLNDPIGNSRFSDRWIEDGSFVRLKAVTLSYLVPMKSERFSVEVFAKGMNLITLTNYLGRDPDFSFSASTLSQGIDLGLTPQIKSITFGVKIGL